MAALRAKHPDLPPEAAPVYFLLCGDDGLTMPAIARRLKLAQSSAARLLTLLAQSGLAASAAEAKRIPRWALTAAGRVLAQDLSER